MSSNQTEKIDSFSQLQEILAKHSLYLQSPVPFEPLLGTFPKLDEVFVWPHLESTNSSLEALLESSSFLPESEEGSTQILRCHPLLWLTAPGGSGKTTLFQTIVHLMNSSTEHQLLPEDSANLPLTLHLQLGEFSQNRFTNLHGLLEEWTENLEFHHSLEISKEFLQSTLEKNGVLLLVDGLDEISKKSRQEVLKVVLEWTKRFSEESEESYHRVIIASRNSMENGFEALGYREYALQPFSEVQITSFLDNYIRIRYPADDGNHQARVSEIFRRIREYPEFENGSFRPFFLTLLAHLVESKGQLPTTRLDAFSQLVESWIRSSFPSSNTDSLFTRENYLEGSLHLLEKIAHENVSSSVQSDKPESSNQAHLLEFTQSLIQENGWDLSLLSNFSSWQKGVQILQEDPRGDLEISNPTLSHYLAAQSIFRNIPRTESLKYLVEQLQPLLETPSGREVVLLFFEIDSALQGKGQHELLLHLIENKESHYSFLLDLFSCSVHKVKPGLVKLWYRLILIKTLQQNKTKESFLNDFYLSLNRRESPLRDKLAKDVESDLLSLLETMFSLKKIPAIFTQENSSQFYSSCSQDHWSKAIDKDENLASCLSNTLHLSYFFKTARQKVSRACKLRDIPQVNNKDSYLPYILDLYIPFSGRQKEDLSRKIFDNLSLYALQDSLGHELRYFYLSCKAPLMKEFLRINALSSFYLFYLQYPRRSSSSRPMEMQLKQVIDMARALNRAREFLMIRDHNLNRSRSAERARARALDLATSLDSVRDILLARNDEKNRRIFKYLGQDLDLDKVWALDRIRTRSKGRVQGFTQDQNQDWLLSRELDLSLHLIQDRLGAKLLSETFKIEGQLINELIEFLTEARELSFELDMSKAKVREFVYPLLLQTRSFCLFLSAGALLLKLDCKPKGSYEEFQQLNDTFVSHESAILHLEEFDVKVRERNKEFLPWLQAPASPARLCELINKNVQAQDFHLMLHIMRFRLEIARFCKDAPQLL